MMRILLVRHGESEWNKIRRLQGQADIELSANGQDQAKALGPTVRKLAPVRAVTSDLKRASETARLLGFGEAERRLDLRENDVGDWTGRDIADLKREDSDGYLGWRAGTVTPPGGEAWTDFRERTGNAVREASEGIDGTFLVVCHGGVIRALLESFLDISPESIIPVGPGSLTILRRPNRADQRMRLELFNFSPRGPVLDAPD